MPPVQEHIKFRAELIRNLAFILAIPFGHLMLGFLLGDFQNIKVKLLFCLPVTFMLCYLAYKVASYSVHILRRENG